MKLNVIIIEFGIKNFESLKEKLLNLDSNRYNFFFTNSFLDIVDLLYQEKIHVIIFSDFRGDKSTIGYIKMFKTTNKDFKLIVLSEDKIVKKDKISKFIQYGADSVSSVWDIDKITNALKIYYYEIIETNIETTHWRDSTKKFINYIKQNYNIGANIIDQLSIASGYSPSTINRYVKEDTGKTPGDWITEIRIKSAIQLLKSTNFTIKYISKQIGYKSQQGFIVALKKSTGKSPKDFRT